MWDRARPALAGRRVAVTGGASFIGSHLCEALVACGARVRVLDNLSTGALGNLEGVSDEIDFHQVDLTDPRQTLPALDDAEIVYHLAAVHGGRGFLEEHPVESLANLVIDNVTLGAAVAAKVGMFVYASSASVYPTDLETPRLPEDAAGLDGGAGSARADGPYGVSKLVGEYQLATVTRQTAMHGVVCRIFNTYGERSSPGHAVRALVDKALAQLDPFPIWGDGSQTRGFVYVGDVVAGLLLCAGLGRSAVVNLGSSDATTISALAERIFAIVGWAPSEISYELDRPQGTTGRVAALDRCRALLDWAPATPLDVGLGRTVAWCRKD